MCDRSASSSNVDGAALLLSLYMSTGPVVQLG